MKLQHRLYGYAVAALGEEVIREAAHSIWAGVYSSEYEERFDGKLPPIQPGRPKDSRHLEDRAPRLPDEVQFPIMAYYLGRIEQAWGWSVPIIFHYMGLMPQGGLSDPDKAKRREHALFDLLMGCFGSGVSLADDFGTELQAAADKLRSRPFSGDPSPIYVEESEWSEIADELLLRPAPDYYSEGETGHGVGLMGM